MGTSGPLVQYTYDAQSRRIATTSSGTTTAVFYDGWNPVAQYATTDFTTYDLART